MPATFPLNVECPHCGQAKTALTSGPQFCVGCQGSFGIDPNTGEGFRLETAAALAEKAARDHTWTGVVGTLGGTAQAWLNGGWSGIAKIVATLAAIALFADNENREMAWGAVRDFLRGSFDRAEKLVNAVWDGATGAIKWSVLRIIMVPMMILIYAFLPWLAKFATTGELGAAAGGLLMLIIVTNLTMIIALAYWGYQLYLRRTQGRRWADIHWLVPLLIFAGAFLAKYGVLWGAGHGALAMYTMAALTFAAAWMIPSPPLPRYLFPAIGVALATIACVVAVGELALSPDAPIMKTHVGQQLLSYNQKKSEFIKNKEADTDLQAAVTSCNTPVFDEQGNRVQQGEDESAKDVIIPAGVAVLAAKSGYAMGVGETAKRPTVYYQLKDATAAAGVPETGMVYRDCVTFGSGVSVTKALFGATPAAAAPAPTPAPTPAPVATSADCKRGGPKKTYGPFTVPATDEDGFQLPVDIYRCDWVAYDGDGDMEVLNPRADRRPSQFWVYVPEDQTYSYTAMGNGSPTVRPAGDATVHVTITVAPGI